MALAFGLQSGLSAAAGIYGAIFLSFFAALFGGTSTQISGPTAPMTAVSMVVIASIIASMEGEIINRIGDKVYIRHPDGPLFFGFASRSQDMIKAMPDISVVIIRMDKVPFVD